MSEKPARGGAEAAARPMKGGARAVDAAGRRRLRGAGAATPWLKNDQGEVSGAKLVLLLACVLALAWLGRDLVTGRELAETHTAVLGILLVVGLLNRISARGRFRLRLGRDGAELETHRDEGRHDDH